MKLNIRQKHIFFILGSTAIIYALIVGYILVISSRNQNAALERNAQLETKHTAAKLSELLTTEMQLVTTLGQSMGVYENMTENEWQDLFIDMMKKVEERNSHLFALWCGVELSAYVPGHTSPGRRQLAVWHERGELKIGNQVKGLEGDSPLYGIARRSDNGCVWEPYLDKAEGVEERIMMISVVAPIRDSKGRFAGVAGSDIGLRQLQKMVEELKPIEGSLACVVSHGGIVAAHTMTDFINKRLEDVFPGEVELHELYQRVARGDEFSYIRFDEKGEQHTVFFCPIYIGETEAPWSMSLSVPLAVIHEASKRTIRLILIFSVLGFIVLATILLLVSNSISRPIMRMTQSLNRLADGEMSDDLTLQMATGDELEEMANALNFSLTGLNSKARFAKAIGDGVYDCELELLSERDALGQSLIQMRDNLRRASDEEAVRRSDAERAAWANAGHARFGELLRQHSDDLQKLCDGVVAEMANYVGVNQVGLFLQADEPDERGEMHYELHSTFAWNRKKHMRKDIGEGEGLVGACVLERAPIYMTDVPDNYITITSGLGEASPRCLLLVPLKTDDEVVGVIELASFRVLEPHETDFIERVADSMAGTIRSVKVNARTRELLEQSQMQAEEMKAQEEEMRQNMEELQATQEEIARKTEEISGFVNSIQSASFVVEYDTNGTVIDVNEAYLLLAGKSRSDVIGKHHSDWLTLTPEQQQGYSEFWDDLRAGHSRKQRTLVTLQGREVELLEVYIPVHDGDGHVIKVMKLGFRQSEFEKNK